MEEQKRVTDRLKELEEKLQDSKRIKKIRIPRRAKVNRSAFKRGYIGVLRVSENGCISGTKIQMEDSAFRYSSQEPIHVSDGREVLFWEGKFPIIIQEDKKLNPKTIKFNEGNNETYGQKYREAKLLKDTITKKKKGGNLGWLLILGVVAVVGYILGKFVFKWF